MTDRTEETSDLLAELHAIQDALPRSTASTIARPKTFRLSPPPAAKASVPARYGITISDLGRVLKDADAHTEPSDPTESQEDDLSDLDEFAALFSPEEDHAPRRAKNRTAGRHLRRRPTRRRVAVSLGALTAATGALALSGAMSPAAQAGDTTPPVTVTADLPEDIEEGVTLVIIEDGRRVTVSIDSIDD